jgi:hypothetical protein
MKGSTSRYNRLFEVSTSKVTMRVSFVIASRNWCGIDERVVSLIRWSLAVDLEMLRVNE